MLGRHLGSVKAACQKQHMVSSDLQHVVFGSDQQHLPGLQVMGLCGKFPGRRSMLLVMQCLM